MRSFTSRDRRSFLRSLVTIFVGALLGCHDVTAPDPVAPLPGPVSHAAAPGAPVVVWPGDLHGWSFVQGAAGKPCDDVVACHLVSGPGTPPLGRGSAELAATNGASAAMMLHEYGGTRLDRLTTLRYATYRQGAAADNDATVTLQLTVQFDASGTTPADVGRLVYEPSRAGGGGVVGDVWQSWNALEGSWWLDREAPQAIRGAAAHPCVRARPCTWAMLLARFPDMTIHHSAGAITVATPKGDFRGNVDSLAVGIDGRTTVFDFELEPRRNNWVLARTFGEGVVVDQFPADTLFPEGTAVPYTFSARPGRAAPLVILDDTLVLPASGRILMDAPHRVMVDSDTIYSYATLTPLEKSIADLTRDLLVSGDKVSAAQAVNSYMLSQVNAGTSGEAVARAAKVAQHVVIDPVRDAVALAEIDAALTGQSFHYQYAGYNGPGQMTTWTSRGWPTMPSRSVIDASPLAIDSLTDGPARASQQPTGLSPLSSAARDVAFVDNMNNPREYTRILYTNGIDTQYDEAFSSALLLASLVYAEPRFRNYYTGVTLHYNPTHATQMHAFDTMHPCVRPFIAASGFAGLPRRILDYALCKGTSYASVITGMDIVESIGARVAFELALPPTNDEVTSIAREAAAYRARATHVILVGHSEGVILQAAAVQQLPALERHPLEVANRCIGVLALAPPTQRVAYGMDEFHLKGLLAEHDIIRLTLPTGWEDVSTPLTREATDSIMYGIRYSGIYVVHYGVRIHGVVETYLTGNVAPVVQSRLATLHRECVPGSANLQLSSSVVPIQQSVTATLDVVNQNNRPLLGRTVTMGRYDYFFDRTDSMTFRAMAPYDGQLRIAAVVSPGLDVSAPIRIPLVRPDFLIQERQLWEWVPVAAANGPNASGSVVAPPTEGWTGAVAECGRQVTNTGAAGNTVTYELRCNRTYTPVYLNADTLVTGRKIVGTNWFYTTPQGVTSVGPPNYYYCPGALACITSGYLELRGAVGIVGRSAVVVPVVVSAPPVVPLTPTVMSRRSPAGGS